MKGTVTFKDGHTESITFYKRCEEDHALLFETDTNKKYYYKAGIYFNEDLGFHVPWSGFYKYNFDSGEWLVTAEIEKVNISEL